MVLELMVYNVTNCYEKIFKKMKIDKKLIKELVDNLKEFDLTELEYQEGQTKIKVSKASKGVEQLKTSAVVPQNKAVLKIF